MNLDNIRRYRTEILWWEICSLMHDIGKLSDWFLFYRQNWHRTPGGYFKDPHDHEWLDKDELLALTEFSGLKKFFETGIQVGEPRVGGELSVRNAVHNHVEPTEGLTKLLKGGDAADSRYDRNNPLFGCEQTDHSDPNNAPEMYRSNVFGYESPKTRVYRGRFKPGDGVQRPERLPGGEGILDRARRAALLEFAACFGALRRRQETRGSLLG